MKKTAIFIAAITIAASVFTAEPATAQTLRHSKGDIYAEYVSVTYIQFYNSVHTYYCMYSDCTQHSSTEIMAASNPNIPNDSSYGDLSVYLLCLLLSIVNNIRKHFYFAYSCKTTKAINGNKKEIAKQKWCSCQIEA